MSGVSYYKGWCDGCATFVRAVLQFAPSADEGLSMIPPPTCSYHLAALDTDGWDGLTAERPDPSSSDRSCRGAPPGAIRVSAAPLPEPEQT